MEEGALLGEKGDREGERGERGASPPPCVHQQQDSDVLACFIWMAR